MTYFIKILGKCWILPVQSNCLHILGSVYSFRVRIDVQNNDLEKKEIL